MPDPTRVDALRTRAVEAAGHLTGVLKLSDVTALTLIAAGLQLLSIGSNKIDVVLSAKDGTKVRVTDADLLAVSNALVSQALQHVLAPSLRTRSGRRTKRNSTRRPIH